MIKTATINVRGLNSIKCQYLRETVRINEIDICFLQETHIKDKDEIQVFNNILVDFLTLFTTKTIKTRGVGILVKKSTGFKISNMYKDFNSRVLGCEINIKGYILNFINIYSPNTVFEQCEFVEYLYDLINTKKNIYLCGDFNFVESEKNRSNIKKNMNNWDLKKKIKFGMGFLKISI